MTEFLTWVLKLNLFAHKELLRDADLSSARLRELSIICRVTGSLVAIKALQPASRIGSHTEEIADEKPVKQILFI